jgi:glycine/D-amino acid oxidase-like deaminating enzyme
MGQMQADVVVLGAGMVGVSVAVHLQKHGKHVVLLDRRRPGEETSYGNGASPATAPSTPITISPRCRASSGRYSVIGATRSPSATPRSRGTGAR